MSIVQVLERLGHKVDYPEAQTCCGQPPFNSGHWDEARAAAQRQMTIFRDAETVVSASGSCGAMIKDFNPELFHNHPREAEARALAAKTLRVLGLPRQPARRARRRRTLSGPRHVSRRLPRSSRTRPEKAAPPVAPTRSRIGIGGNVGGGNLLRFWRHVRGQVSDDFHRNGRSQMRLHRRHRRGLCHFQRFQLPDANSRHAGPAGQIRQNVAPRRSAGAT